MRRYRNRHDGTEVALANFALTFAKALLVFCVVLFLMINPHKGKDGVKPDAEFLITADWRVAGRYDVDTWTRLPNGSLVGYSNRESGVVFLERDDLGQDCDATTKDGKPIDTCEETVVIRGIVPGEYQVSLHLFSANLSEDPMACAPVTVRVMIHKLNPETTIIWQGAIVLDRVREEKPVVRFTIHADASIDSVTTDDLPHILDSLIGSSNE